MLQIKNLFTAAIKCILKNRMRSLLTSLGIIIGVAAVIVMVSIGEGASAQIESQISSLGTDLLMVKPGASKRGGVSRGAGSHNRFTLVDIKKIKEKATLLKAVSPVVRVNSQVIGGGSNWNTTIYGVDPSYLYIRNLEIESGTIFTDSDIKSRKKVAVIGQTVVDELFADINPVGQKIRIRNTPFTVIGVLKEKGENSMGQDQDDVVLAPSTSVLYRLKGGIYIDEVYASSVSSSQIYDAEQELEVILRDAHRIKDGADSDFHIRNQAEINEMASSTTETMTILLGSIAAVSLFVGGIGIMNIMLVSVTERTREIGIRLSIGARGSDILIQFLAEAVILSLIGGLLGIGLAVTISYFIDSYTSLNTLLDPYVMLLAFLFAGAVGVFFGYYPARKAAALNPIDALRYE